MNGPGKFVVRRVGLITLLLAAACGCSDGNQNELDAGADVDALADGSAVTDDAADAGADTATDAGTDAGGDIGTDAASDAAGADGEPDPTPLPLGPEAVMTIGSPGAIEIGSTGWVAPDGSLRVVWERFDAEFTNATLLLSQSADGASWTAPEPLSFGDAVFQASPSFVTRGDTADLYLVRSTGIYAAPEVVASTLTDEDFAPAEALAPVPGIDSLLSWPRFCPAGNGRTAVAFRTGTGKPQAAFSQDGRSFDPPVTVSDQGAAMPALGRFADGGYAYTFQTGSGGVMSSWVCLSQDGTTWSEPVPVTDASTNVHDTTLVPRLDGGIDLYYIHPAGGAGFSLHRRALDPAGTLGPAQQVTLPEAGETSKPEGLRLPDGRLLLLWAAITRRGAGGAPTEQVLQAALLCGDAPGDDNGG